jgi:hypothetical protein
VSSLRCGPRRVEESQQNRCLSGAYCGMTGDGWSCHDRSMTAKLEPITINGVDLLVATTLVPGAERTSGLGKPGEKVLNAFDAAQDAIVELAAKLGHSIGEMARRSIHPKQVEVEFGIAFGSNGGIIIAGASIEASLKVTITYDRPDVAPTP